MGGSRKLGRVRRLVVKVGSGLVTKAGAGIAPDRIDALAAEIAAVREGRRVVLVTSGAPSGRARSRRSRPRRPSASRRSCGSTRPPSRATGSRWGRCC